MDLREPQNYYDDCYFCALDLVELNKRTKNLPSSAIQAWNLQYILLLTLMTYSLFKESILSDIEPSEHHEEASDSSDMKCVC